MKTDIIIVGSGVAGLYAALNLPKDKKIVIVTKDSAKNSDSYLAQGGICVLRDAEDYESFYEDTMKAGHYENKPESVDIMIRSSKGVIEDLENFGVRFEKEGNEYIYTREGAHSKPRILYHKDITGKEITSCLLKNVKRQENITLIEQFTMVDWICENNECFGIIGQNAEGEFVQIEAEYTILATGGVGGLFEHSTNFRHLTGDALALAIKHNVKLKHIDYVQIHPTTFYSEKNGRKFLISESVRGEGAILLNSKKERFVNELLPRDVVANAIFDEMKKEGSQHVWLSLENIPREEIIHHFPNIYEFCLEAGYDITKECIPVVPAQHYFMGGIDVNEHSKTSMERLYAIGETACNGVHGRNRLASNSLLESLVFAKRAAKNITERYVVSKDRISMSIDVSIYENYKEEYKKLVLDAIKKEKEKNE